MGLLLFLVAYILFLPLTIINYWFVEVKKGYFRSSALNIDKFANREFRSLWNKVLIVNTGYNFGNTEETISSALGKNQRDNTLTGLGKAIAFILDKIDENHCLNSIDN